MTLTTPASTSVSTADRLRDAARALFAERGYSGASLGEICARVGIRKPSVYNHFRSKDALFLDLLERSLDDWGEASRPALHGSGGGSGSGSDDDGEPALPSCRERLEAHLRAAVRFAVERPHATALCRVAVSHVGGELEEAVRELLLCHRSEYHASLRRFFDEAKERGEVRRVETEALALGWLTFLDGILSHQLFGIGERRERFLDHLDALWDQYWRGIRSEDG